jgi:hypothetical protein
MRLLLSALEPSLRLVVIKLRHKVNLDNFRVAFRLAGQSKILVKHCVANIRNTTHGTIALTLH